MAKDTPVLTMAILLLIMIAGILFFGVVENAKYSSSQQITQHTQTTKQIGG